MSYSKKKKSCIVWIPYHHNIHMNCEYDTISLIQEHTPRTISEIDCIINDAILTHKHIQRLSYITAHRKPKKNNTNPPKHVNT